MKLRQSAPEEHTAASRFNILNIERSSRGKLTSKLSGWFYLCKHVKLTTPRREKSVCKEKKSLFLVNLTERERSQGQTWRRGREGGWGATELWLWAKKTKTKSILSTFSWTNNQLKCKFVTTFSKKPMTAIWASEKRKKKQASPYTVRWKPHAQQWRWNHIRLENFLLSLRENCEKSRNRRKRKSSHSPDAANTVTFTNF